MVVKNAAVGGEIFLQNTFMDVGINAYGTLGSIGAAPAGFYSDIGEGYKRVGLYADTDGFTSGKASTLHDAMLPGTEIEGFNVGYKIGSTTYARSNDRDAGVEQIAGTSINASTSTNGEADWNGTTSENLGIAQKITLVDGAKYLRVDVTLTNNSSTTMNDVHYMRTIDPDQGAGYATKNTIVSQGADSGTALLTASDTNGKSPFFYYAKDARAEVSSYGFINKDPYQAPSYEAAQSAGYSITKDQSDNIDFTLGTLGAGKSTTLTFYMGVTDNVAATVAAIELGSVLSTAPTVPVVAAPSVVNDLLAAVAGKMMSGDVLSNDSDPAGKTLTATMASGPSHGTLKLSSDGTYTYAANAGYTGSDSFTYTASNGSASATGSVAITITAPIPTLPTSTTLQRAGTLDGSAATNDTLTGTSHNNSFYFDIDAKSGADKITNFSHGDVIVTNEALTDGNGDGIIAWRKAFLSLDTNKTADTVVIDGTKSLRSLGTDASDLHVYADASTRPTNAIEGTLGDDVLTSGDLKDKKTNKFFFDTGLDLNLGHDSVAMFGAKDVLVTTSALSDAKVGGTVALDAAGSVNLLAEDHSVLGSVSLTDTAGAALHAIEFDGSAVHGGTTYYVYSMVGSSAGVATLGY